VVFPEGFPLSQILPKEFIMLSNEVFALACRAYYEEQGLIVDETNGEFAHSPLTRKECNTGYYLLHNHHQHQGLLQSRDLNKCCFFSGYVKKWLLTCNYFPDNYFELWDIYEQYANTHAKESAEKLHAEKDEFGKSLHALKANAILHAERNEDGKSIRALAHNERIHSDKNEDGKSMHAVSIGSKGGEKGSRTTNNQLWESTIDGFQGRACSVALHNKFHGWDTNARVRIK
jgi:hypothetical protein